MFLKGILIFMILFLFNLNFLGVLGILGKWEMNLLVKILNLLIKISFLFLFFLLFFKVFLLFFFMFKIMRMCLKWVWMILWMMRCFLKFCMIKNVLFTLLFNICKSLKLEVVLK